MPLWEKLWHNLQTVVNGQIARDGSNIPEVFAPIHQCGMKPDFEAEISTIEDKELASAMGVSLSDYKLIIADCRKGKSGKVLPLHIPKKDYVIHQNKNLFDCMVKSAIQVLGNDGFEIVTVGTLGSYSQFFVSLAIKGSETFNVGTLPGKGKDEWKQFYNLNSSHNGLIASMRGLSYVRMVCFNTVNMAQRDMEANGTHAKIKHTKNSTDLITPEVFETDLNYWLNESKAFQALLNYAKGQKMTLDGFKSFASGVFTNEDSSDLSTTSFNRVTTMLPLFQRGTGGGNSGSSLYDALQAFTDWGTNSQRGDNIRKHIATANFGRANEWKLEAIRVASNETLLAETMARGERLYAEKEKAIAKAK
jgi:hypothetical protein